MLLNQEQILGDGTFFSALERQLIKANVHQREGNSGS
jgi:hypothetical protein